MEKPGAAVTELAATQHALITYDQLQEFGLSRKVVARCVGHGWLTKVSSKVVRIAGAPVTWESKVMAAVLSAGETAVASHRTAAVLWNLEGFRQGGPELTVPNGRWSRSPGVRTHESTDLGLVRPVRRSAIPVTPVARTLLDLGAVMPRQAVLLAVDDARRRGLVDWDQLLDTLVAHARRGRRGVGVLRSILDEHFGEAAATDSGFERLVAVLLRQAGLPAPVLQHRVRVDGRDYRIDLAYPANRLALELDGGIHMRRDLWENDHLRQNALILAGWTVLRFTWREYAEHPGRLVAAVRAALPSQPS
jgi:very-short-patch-repair endonuclease